MNWGALGFAILVGGLLVHGLMRGRFPTWRWRQQIVREKRPISFAIEVILRAAVFLTCLGFAFPGPSLRLLHAIGIR